MILELVICTVICYLTYIVSARLWRKGGDGNTIWRSFGVPVVIASLKFLLTQNPLVLLYIPALFLMLRGFSYGVSAPPHKFWVWVFGWGSSGNNTKVELATRMTCCFFWSLASLVFVFAGGSWWWFGGYVVLTTCLGGWIGAYIQDVEISEPATGTLVAFSMLV